MVNALELMRENTSWLPRLRPLSPLPSSKCSCVCGSPMLDVGYEVTQMNAWGTDWIFSRSSVNPLRT
jgi:hypothetical protein